MIVTALILIFKIALDFLKRSNFLKTLILSDAGSGLQPKIASRVAQLVVSTTSPGDRHRNTISNFKDAFVKLYNFTTLILFLILDA
jgi:hypothetical protein